MAGRGGTLHERDGARRRLLVALATCAWPGVGVHAQVPRQHRIALLGVATPTGYAAQVAALRRGLRELGYVEATNLVVDERWANGDLARLPALAGDLLRASPDVLVTSGPGIGAARRATTTVPIVMAAGGDAVATGAVASFAQPGGNVTGSSFVVADLGAKRLQVLAQAGAALRRVGVLVFRGSSVNEALLRAMAPVAAQAGVEVRSIEVADAAGIAAGLRVPADRRLGGLVVSDHPLLVAESRRIATVAREQGLPSIGFADFAREGGLLGYGVDFALMWHRAAYFVDRILKGAKPASIPVEQPSRFELVVNLATARALGIAIPESLRVRADSVVG